MKWCRRSANGKSRVQLQFKESCKYQFQSHTRSILIYPMCSQTPSRYFDKLKGESLWSPTDLDWSLRLLCCVLLSFRFHKKLFFYFAMRKLYCSSHYYNGWLRSLFIKRKCQMSWFRSWRRKVPRSMLKRKSDRESLSYELFPEIYEWNYLVLADGPSQCLEIYAHPRYSRAVSVQSFSSIPSLYFDSKEPCFYISSELSFY